MLPVSGAEQLNTSLGEADAAEHLADRRIFEIGQLDALELEVIVHVGNARHGAA